MPHYETEEDLKRESLVADIIKDYWKCELHKLHPYKYKIDYLAILQDKCAFIEIKCRNMNFGDYSFMISLNKIVSAKELVDVTHSKFFLFYKTNDLICYHQWDFNKKYPLEYGGRTKTTRTETDLEPVFRIYPEDCKILHRFDE